MTEEKKKCVPCTLAKKAFTPDEIKQQLHRISSDWTVFENHHIVRTFQFKNFKKALSFVNEIGDIAEQEGHHPNIELSYGKVKITFWTHKVDGLTASDFTMAEHVDASFTARLS